MNATVDSDSQQRWQRFYEEFSQKNGQHSYELIEKRVASRLLWERIMMVGSTAALVVLTSVFYSVLTR